MSNIYRDLKGCCIPQCHEVEFIATGCRLSIVELDLTMLSWVITWFTTRLITPKERDIQLFELTISDSNLKHYLAIQSHFGLNWI